MDSQDSHASQPDFSKPDSYKLVSCDFHDQLEAFATLRQMCKLVYHNSAGEVVETQGLIVDVYSANKADFLKLKDGTEIRLDKLVSVNDIPNSLESE